MKKPWHDIPYNEEALGLQEVSRKYAIPFPWGALHVTEGAEADYGFVPLAHNLVMDDSDAVQSHLGKNERRTDIFLMAEGEYTQQLASPIDKPAGIEFATLEARPFAHPKGFEVFTAAAINREREAEILEHMAVGGLRQFLIHQFCQAVGGNLQPAYEQAAIHSLRQDTYYDVRNQTLSGIIGGTLFAGLSYYEPIPQSFNAYSILAAVYPILFIGIAAKKGMRFIKELPNIHAGAITASQQLASRVATSIHDTYCSDTFNQNEEQWLGGDSGYDPDGNRPDGNANQP